MNDIRLNVYDEDFTTVKKTVSAKFIKLPFGFVRKIMKLCDIENAQSNADLLKIVSASWGTITKLLSNIFPEMEEDDWDGVDIRELMQVVYEIIKKSITALNDIPKDPN